MSDNATVGQYASGVDSAEIAAGTRLPETGYLRLHQIVGRPPYKGQPAIPALIPVSRSTWWAGVKSGRFPKPVRTLGANITAWRVEDIRELLARLNREAAD